MKLLYDHLVKWSKSNFTKVVVPQYKRFNLILVEKQPAALTELVLEETIDTLLYPGIEMSWNTEEIISLTNNL